MGKMPRLSKLRPVGGSGLAGLTVLKRMLLPGARWYLERRSDSVLAEVNERLHLKVPDFGFAPRRALVERLVHDPRVVEAAEIHSEEHDVSMVEIMAEVERYAQEIVPAFNAYVYFKIGTRLSRTLAQRLYDVRIGFTHELALEKVEPQPTVVFVMNHRSNVDYVLLAYLAAKRTALSYAAGEWARVWPLEQLVRSMGAFFVRRGSVNPLYRRVLERWVQLATEGGMVQAVFPESGLSRDGHLREPRLGLLNYMLRRFDPLGVRDVVFIPVGVNYDWVLEDRSLVADRDPEGVRRSPVEAVTDTASFFARNLRLALGREERHGYAVVNFGAPVSMREYCRTHGVDFRRMGIRERSECVEDLARRLMSEVAGIMPVLPAPVVAHLFLEHPDETMEREEVAARTLALISALHTSGAHVYFPRGDRSLVPGAGLEILTRRNLVLVENKRYRAAPGEERLLRYYANSIRHFVPAPTPTAR